MGGELYAMYYTGIAGSGHAVFVMKDGVVAGADPMGGVLDGTYEALQSGNLAVAVELRMPPGTWLVTGASSGQEGAVQRIEAELPPDLGAGNPVAVSTPTGPVNVVFRHIRSLP